MLRVRVQLINGQEHLVDTNLSVDQFDDSIKFANPSDFIIDNHGTRLQVSKILTHKPLEEISNG
jgi:hypothetical protein